MGRPDHRVLVTIPISHFCEKARWALERAGLDYEERRHIQIVHQIAARRAGGGKTAPVLATPDGVFADSRAIMRYADEHLPASARLYPADRLERKEVLALEDRFDAVIGIEGRRWLYHEVFKDPKPFTPYNLTGVPAWERRVFPFVLAPAKLYINRYLDIDDATAARALERVDEELAFVAELLSDGRRYLVGDRFSAADLAFAALCAPLVVPVEYGTPLPQPAIMPAAMAERVGLARAPRGPLRPAPVRRPAPGDGRARHRVTGQNPGGAADCATMTAPTASPTREHDRHAVDDRARQPPALGQLEHEVADGEPRGEAAEMPADRDARDEERDREVQHAASRPGRTATGRCRGRAARGSPRPSSRTPRRRRRP